MVKRYRLLSLLLCITVSGLLVLLAACGENKPADTTPAVTDTTTAAPVVTEPVTTEARPAVYDNADFEDYECHLLLGLTSLGRDEFITEDTSTVLSNAVYRRQKLMEENFGVYVSTEPHYTGGFSSNTTLAKEYTSGDNNYDFAISRILDVAPLTVNGHLYDLTTLENLDLSKPWWDQAVVKDSTVADSVYFASGDISTLVNDFVCCVAFNKDMFENEVGEKTSVLYELTESGNWTLDKLNEYSSKVSEDLNNDEILDSRDKYGLTVWDSRVIATVHAAGGKIVTLNDEGLLELTMYTERNAAAVEKFVSYSTQPYSLNMTGMSGGVNWKTIFVNGQALFTMSSFNSLDYFRNLETDYGILPQPKTFEDQDSYYSSVVSVHACFFCVPAIQEDAGRTGAIAELFGYLGQSTLTPAYYDKTLIGNSIRDDESAGSIKISFDTKVIDLGDYFSIGNYYSNLASLLNNKNAAGFTTMYETGLNIANKKIETVNEQIQNLKALSGNN